MLLFGKQRDIFKVGLFISSQMLQTTVVKYWAVHGHCFTVMSFTFLVKHNKQSKVEYLTNESHSNKECIRGNNQSNNRKLLTKVAAYSRRLRIPCSGSNLKPVSARPFQPGICRKLSLRVNWKKAEMVRPLCLSCERLVFKSRYNRNQIKGCRIQILSHVNWAFVISFK